MILDKLGQLCKLQALTGSAISTNVIDLGVAGSGLPDGTVLECELTVDVAADATTGDETYSFSVDTSAVVGLTTPTSLCTRAIARGLLTAGSKHRFPLAPGVAMLQFLGINFTLGGTTPLITVTAHIIPNKLGESVQRHYPSGFAVL